VISQATAHVNADIQRLRLKKHQWRGDGSNASEPFDETRWEWLIFN
jgi:hypothetical protein